MIPSGRMIGMSTYKDYEIGATVCVDPDNKYVMVVLDERRYPWINFTSGLAYAKWRQWRIAGIWRPTWRDRLKRQWHLHWHVLPYRAWRLPWR